MIASCYHKLMYKWFKCCNESYHKVSNGSIGVIMDIYINIGPADKPLPEPIRTTRMPAFWDTPLPHDYPY